MITFTAEYGSTCSVCDREIRPGQACVVWLNDTVHAGCSPQADGVDRTPPPTPVRRYRRRARR